VSFKHLNKYICSNSIENTATTYCCMHLQSKCVTIVILSNAVVIYTAIVIYMAMVRHHSVRLIRTISVTVRLADWLGRSHIQFRMRIPFFVSHVTAAPHTKGRVPPPPPLPSPGAPPPPPPPPLLVVSLHSDCIERTGVSPAPFFRPFWGWGVYLAF
jgi:hypothetical protein